MKIEDFIGPAEVNTLDELQRILRRRLPSGYNSFWLTHQNRYPAISLLAKDDLAYVQYFPEDGHPGFHSISDPPVISQEFLEFRVDTPEQPQPVMGEAVVFFDNALVAAQEFLSLPIQPTCLDWREL